MTLLSPTFRGRRAQVWLLGAKQAQGRLGGSWKLQQLYLQWAMSTLGLAVPRDPPCEPPKEGNGHVLVSCTSHTPWDGNWVCRGCEKGFSLLRRWEILAVPSLCLVPVVQKAERAKLGFGRWGNAFSCTRQENKEMKGWCHKPPTLMWGQGCSVWLWNQGHQSCKWCWSPLCRAGGLSVGNSCPTEAGEKTAIIGAHAHLKYLTSELKNWSLFFPLQKLFGLEPSRPHLLFCNWIEPFVRIFKNNYYKALQEEFWLSSSFHFMLSWHFCSRMNLLWNVCFRLHPPEAYYLP